ncbi:MAG: metal ABC transporter permease [Acholeplasmataceae bacterium]
MIDFFTYSFLQEALLIAIIISISASLLSPFLVLNQQGMIAHGLSHVSFTGLVIGLLFFDQPLWLAIPFVMISSILIQYMQTTIKIQGDVSIGIVTSFTFALGLILVKTNSSFNVSIESLLVGNIFTLRSGDLILASLILLLIGLFVKYFYKQLFLMTYDENYATFLKINVSLIRYFLAILTSLFIVIGVRSIGVLLITSFIIFPSAIASRMSHSFKSTFFIGIAVAFISSVLGIVVAHPLNVPASAMIVMIYTLLFLGSSLYSKMKG